MEEEEDISLVKLGIHLGHNCVSNLTSVELAISRTVLVSAMAFKLGMTVDLCIMGYMLMLVTMTLTLAQGHSGSAKANHQR